MMSPQWTRVPLPLALVLVLSGPAWAARSDRTMVSEEYVGATVNATVLDARGNPVHLMSSEDGTYGQDSPKVDTRTARVIAPATHHGVVDRQGCDPSTRFLPPPRGPWVALLQRGNCTFKEKILKAAAYNATAVLIYNNSTDKTVRMGHEATNRLIYRLIYRLLTSPRPGSSSTSSRSYSSARDRSQRRLGDAAKKAIGKLTTRTVKKGDKETDPDFNHCAVCIEAYQLNDVVRILPCKHVFHKVCVDPWLNEHCTCPMCKLNILKALGIVTSVPCVDSVVLDVDRLGVSVASGSHRAPPGDSSQPSISLEPLSPPHPEAPSRTPADITIAVTSGHFFSRNSSSPRSLVCEMELPDIEAEVGRYDDNKS
ncbi:E3 ubiquitin-protein ligase RNF130 [Etheostoma cragini]|uniref:E3 ubiquitin-protein ligase RNF130 n=1 Tax=Etheostoma cragini TaxID=417921 RepID=UPI00155E41AE|nr:E3 ubiquitin-protein ligase RNF130 [Etheostoma cragini]